MKNSLYGIGITTSRLLGDFLKFKTNTFYCFSPLVMMITFFIEIGLLGYILVTRKKSLATKLVAIILFCLALFQLSEYGVCENLGLDHKVWARIGLNSISVLPVVGLHLIMLMAKRVNKPVLAISYTTMLLWMATFAFSGIVENHQCGGNYLIVKLSNVWGGLFTAWYFLLLFGGIMLARWAISKTNKKVPVKALKSMIIGYLAFMLPAAIVIQFSEETALGLPSIMCGFAIIFAVILATYTLPHYEKSHK